MKKIVLTLAIAFASGYAALAQAPKGFNYQGVARNVSGSPIANASIQLRLTVHKGTATGTVMYRETHNVVTNTFGLYNVVVGRGTPTVGTFNPTDPEIAGGWGNYDMFLQVEIDESNTGNEFVSLGSSQLMSVPYALFAANGPTGAKGDPGPAGAAGPTGPTGLTGPSGAPDTIIVGTGLLGGTITSKGTISMPSLGTPGTYGSATDVPVITTDAQGRVTAVVSTPINENWGTQTVVTDPTLSGNGTSTSPLKIDQQGAAMGQILQWNGSTWGPASVGGTGTVVSVGTAAPLTGGPITSGGTISMLPSGVTPGTYGTATQVHTVTVDAFGRVTGAANAPLTIAGDVTGPNTAAVVTGIQSRPVAATAPTTGQNLQWNGTAWAPAAGGGLSGWADRIIKFTGPNTGGNSRLIDTSQGLLYNAGTFMVNTTPVTNKFYYRASTATGFASNWFSFGGDATNSFSFLTVSDSGTGNRGLLVASSQEVNGIAAGTSFGNAFGLVYNQGLNQCFVTDGAGFSAATFDMSLGDFDVAGNLTKFSGTFKIDHPLDPANKYLYHSFVESPDMMNVYNGNITTDASGNATVKLPDYFEALNKDFRYQLTVIGATFAQAVVSEEVSANQFKIKTSLPNTKVSWQVTGIRHDAYANDRPIVPEVVKEDRNKGKYLYPKGFGQPKSMGINYKESQMTNAASKNAK